MENLYNVIIFFGENINMSIIKHFENKKLIKNKLSSPTKNSFPSIYKHGCFSLVKKNIHKNKFLSPQKSILPNIHKNKYLSPTKFNNLIYNKYNNPISSPYKIKNTNKINTPPYNKNIFKYDVMKFNNINNNKLLKQNILTRDGIIIILQNIDNNMEKILFEIVCSNYSKPIMILFDMNNDAENNEYFKRVDSFNKKLKKILLQQIVNIKYYFPTISLIRNNPKNIKYINIDEKYERNPIDIFTEQLKSKEIKTFSINPENYPDDILIKEFKNLTGIPMVLNTSFNENEPIVCKPEEALETFLRTKMDILVIDNWKIERKN